MMKTTNTPIYVFCLIGVLVLCLSVAGPGMAQVPKKINYQGYLQDSVTDLPVTGTVQMEFALYDVPIKGSPLWSETQQVEVNDGRYSVHLGAVTPLILTEAKPYYLRISIDGEVLTDDNGEEYREELTSGLYGLFLNGESGENPAPDPPNPPWPGPFPGPTPMPNENTFYGTNAGANTTTGRQNTFIGHEAGLLNTEGHTNTFVGDDAGRANTTGAANTFLGHDAGRANTESSANTFVGNNAGRANTEGDYNTFVGHDAGWANTEGFENTFVGDQAGLANTWGFYNTFVGRNAGLSNTSGHRNTFIGYEAGQATTAARDNTFVGFWAGFSNSTGWNNTIIGNFAGFENLAGNHNTMIGVRAGATNPDGEFNTFLGYEAGRGNQGSRNVFLGYEAGKNESGSDKLYIHNADSSTPLIYGEFNTPLVRIHGHFYVTGNAYKPGGGSWLSSSDRRLKEIQGDYTSGLDALAHVQPVSYRYKAENPLHLPSERSYVGVVAQEVQQIIPEAVEEGENGYLMVNNDPIIWTMLNAIKELKAQDDVLKAQNEALKAQNEALKAQNERIMKEIELLKKALGQ